MSAVVWGALHTLRALWGMTHSRRKQKWDRHESNYTQVKTINAMQKEMNMKVQALRQDVGKMEMETARKVKIQKQEIKEIKETSPLKVKVNQTGNHLKNNSTTTAMA